eukprot:10641146-Lingulodinium_polyedra.AAC.1
MLTWPRFELAPKQYQRATFPRGQTMTNALPKSPRSRLWGAGEMQMCWPSRNGLKCCLGSPPAQ